MTMPADPNETYVDCCRQALLRLANRNRSRRSKGHDRGANSRCPQAVPGHDCDVLCRQGIQLIERFPDPCLTKPIRPGH